MTSVQDHYLVKWIIWTSTFLAVLANPGCSHHDSSAVVGISSQDYYSPTVPVINVFGQVMDTPAAPESFTADSSLRQCTFADDGFDADVAVDPTGTRLLFASTRHTSNANLYMQRIGGSAITQLTSGSDEHAHPTFSPDGKRIAFASTRAGNWDLYVMGADGRNPVQLTNTPAQEIHPSFSPDGTRLAYCALSSRSGQWELWVLNLSSGQKQVIGEGLFPRWSPSKQVDRIAFQRAKGRGSHAFSIWTLDLVDGEPRNLTEIATSAQTALVNPCWSPDGAWLAVGAIPLSDKASTGRDIWLVSADGSARRRITEGTASNLSPVWAVDNQVYFVSDRSGRDTVWSVAAGQNQAALSPVADVHETGH